LIMGREEFQNAGKAKRPNLLQELLGFLAHNKKWWLTPIIICLLLLGVLIILGGSAAAPFIYSLF
jgi:hypothetical protein